MLATPTFAPQVDVRYTDALANSIKLCAAHGIDLCPVFMTKGPVETLRNDLVAIAVRQPAVTDVVWIDADIVWQPDWVLRLLMHPVDVVGGTYPRKQFDEAYVVGAAPAQLVADDKGLMQVNHLGCGFLRMSRKALLTLWTRGKPYKVAGGGEGSARREVFKWEIVGGERISEDVFMCRTLRAAGFAINLDPAVCCQHIGEAVFTGNFVAFVDKLKAGKKVHKNVRKGRGAGSRR